MQAKNTVSATVSHQPLTEPEKDLIAWYRLPFWSGHQDLAELAEEVCQEAIENSRQTSVDERVAAWLEKNPDSAAAAMWREHERRVA